MSRTRLSVLLLAGWLAAITLQPAHAQEARGARSCQGWQEFRIEERADRPLTARIYQTWLIGYLTGLSAGSGVDFLSGTSNVVIFRLVDGFCGDNPLANLAEAGSFVARLLAQQRLRPPMPWLP